MTLNNALQPDSRQGGTDPMEVWAAIAAKFSGTLNKPDEEPGVAMAKTFRRHRVLWAQISRMSHAQVFHVPHAASIILLCR